jgi:hypothetical protein
VSELKRKAQHLSGNIKEKSKKRTTAENVWTASKTKERHLKTLSSLLRKQQSSFVTEPVKESQNRGYQGMWKQLQKKKRIETKRALIKRWDKTPRKANSSNGDANRGAEQHVRIFQKSNTHKFTWFGNLPTPRSYWFVLINQRNNTNKEEEKTLFNSTLLTQALSILLLSFSLFSTLILSSSMCLIIDRAWGKKSWPSWTPTLC